MSQTKYPLASDIKRITIELVRGYDRRLAVYRAAQQSIIDGSTCNYVEYVDPRTKKTMRQYFPHSSAVGDPTADKAIRMAALEDIPETLRMRVVEEARKTIGLDIQSPKERERLNAAIWDSCIQGRYFIFEHRNLCVSQNNFYERRRGFLTVIAKKAGLL